METLCKIRDLYRSIGEFEVRFSQKHGICLNEGMLLCSLKSGQKSSGELAELLGLTPSNTSKVIKSVENKGLVQRVFGESDKRQMYFFLTPSGEQLMKSVRCDQVDVPDLLLGILNK